MEGNFALPGTQESAMVHVAGFTSVGSKVVTLTTRRWSTSKNKALDNPQVWHNPACPHR